MNNEVRCNGAGEMPGHEGEDSYDENFNQFAEEHPDLTDEGLKEEYDKYLDNKIQKELTGRTVEEERKSLKENLLWEDEIILSLEEGEDMEDLAEELFNHEKNFKHCDPTTGQKCWSTIQDLKEELIYELKIMNDIQKESLELVSVNKKYKLNILLNGKDVEIIVNLVDYTSSNKMDWDYNSQEELKDYEVDRLYEYLNNSEWLK